MARRLPRLRGWAGDPYPTLTADAAARLAGWVGWLDVDLQLAQTMLRKPVGDLPPLPSAVDDPVVDVEPVARPVGLRGAYARRFNSDRADSV